MSKPTLQMTRELIEAVQLLETSQSTGELASVKALLTKAKAAVAQSSAARRRQASDFNVFEALGVSDNETVHSRFLAYLFDPRAQHNQGTLFLQSFLDRFLVDRALPQPTVEETFVHREFVTAFGRLDTAIFLPSGVCICLENKIWAFEQEDQILRYQKYLASLKGSSTHLIVFLSPNGDRPETVDPESAVPVVWLSYEQIAFWLTSLLSHLPVSLELTLKMFSASCIKISARSRKSGL